MTKNGPFFSSRCILNYSKAVLKDENLGYQQICKKSKKMDPWKTPKHALGP